MPAKYSINPINGTLDRVLDEANLTQNIQIDSEGGYEFSGAFTARGANTEYTAAMVSDQSWLRFGFDSASQITNDAPYWGDGTDPDEAPHSGTTDYQGVGLFSGAYMPEGVTSMFDYTANTAYNNAVTSGSLQYSAAGGSYDMSELQVGDFCQFRWDFNIIPQFTNTTVEIALIWATRDSNDNITFTFPLTTSPIFFGSGTTGRTFLNRPMITAYLASAEDVNAQALPAIRADQPIFIEPLTTLFTVGR